MSDSQNKLRIYKANYTSFNEWILDQTFDISSVKQRGKIDA